MHVGEEKEGHSSAGNGGFGTLWTPTMDCYLLDLLLDQTLRGNKIGLSFTSEAWMEIVIMFNHKFESRYDVDVLKKRYKHLRKQYNNIKILLEQSGFSWDDMKEMVIAEDHVWDSYVEVNYHGPIFLYLRYTSLYHLCMVYAGTS